MKITAGKLIEYIRHLHRQDKPTKQTIALLLQATGISRFFAIDRGCYRIRFSTSSALARTLWISPDERIWDERFISSYLRRGDTLVDVGANIGTVTFAGASKVGSAGRVISIEAHPRTFECLVENGEFNGFTNIQYHNCAIGDTTGIVGFSDIGDDDQNRVMESGAIHVETTSLDDILQNIGITSVDLLKIDVEGYEKKVLAGATKTLDRTNCVYIETCEHNLTRYRTGSSEVLRMLKGCGFQLFQIDNRTEDTVAVKEPKNLPCDMQVHRVVPDAQGAYHRSETARDLDLTDARGSDRT